MISRRRLLQGAALGSAAALTGFGGSLLWANQAVRQFANDFVLPLTPWVVNTYLLRGTRPVLVDTGFPADETAIREGLATQELTPANLSLILVTHGHYDHFGSAAALQAGTYTPVAAHPLAHGRLMAGRPTHVEVLTRTGQFISALPVGTDVPVPVASAVNVDDGDTLDASGITARVIHTPGHTDGSVSLLVDGIALVGDLMAGNVFYPNQPSCPWFIDDLTDRPEILTSMTRLLDAGAQTFFPGHGMPFDRASATRWLRAQAVA